jgi:hypothetical protein
MDKHSTYSDIAKQRVRVLGQRRDMRDELHGRATRYRNYGEALQAFASKLKAAKIRRKLLLVADEFIQKAASIESIAGSRRIVACRRT